MKRYKLIKQDRTSYAGMKWPIGKWNKAAGIGTTLCTDGYLHCYDDPYLALFLNPIHADIKNPIVCEVQTRGKSLNESGLKRGYKEMVVVKDLPDVSVTASQRIAFGILCSLEVREDKAYILWANNWLLGVDRSYAAAQAAAYVAAQATPPSAYAAAQAAAYAAAQAAAAQAAAQAAAAQAAYAVARAAVYDINLIMLARKALRY